MDCYTCKHGNNKTVATCVDCGDEFTNWQPVATEPALTRTAEQWSMIDASMVAAECSPSMIRELIEDAIFDITMLHSANDLHALGASTDTAAQKPFKNMGWLDTVSGKFYIHDGEEWVEPDEHKIIGVDLASKPSVQVTDGCRWGSERFNGQP